ncbi:RiPP maturation radical SAM C-methyltransferase [Actinorhabdospora filicis]|nr:RiPP maturation radical SAM C-methyltransferase [Actinorhabdospora filicis]
MPWASLHRPSLGVGILAAAARRVGAGRVDQLYASLEWAQYLMERSGGEITPEAYTHVAERYFAGAGEWVFAAALHGESSWQVEEFTSYTRACTDLDPDLLVRMQELAEGFVDELCERITARGYDVVGFSSTFMQNVPSLALAKRVKAARPETKVVFGGGNCDGEQGEALHRNFPFVDLVVRGEADTAFPLLLAALRKEPEDAERMLRRIPGLCWRKPDGRVIVNPVLGQPVALHQARPPDYEDYFTGLQRTGIDAWVEPELVLEASRGCWWGEKHQCTFCGLNGSAIGFRSKPQDQFLDELAGAVERYRVLDVTLADNILDMKYFADFVPGLAARDWDLRIHCEVKANLTEAHVRELRKAGVVNLQPGIESLSSQVLKIMDKGITGTRNVRLLRDCGHQKITVEWNWLYGFPGEEVADYRAVLDQLPALVHLQPPSGAFRIALERFSPYFEQPELGLVNEGPAAIYSMIYDLPQEELASLVYLFDSTPNGISGVFEAELQRAVAAWEANHAGSTLTYSVTDDGVIVHEGRRGREARDHLLPFAGRAEAFLALAKDRTPVALLSSLRPVGVAVSEAELTGWLDEFVREGWVFVENGRYLALATPTAHPDHMLTGDELRPRVLGGSLA